MAEHMLNIPVKATYRIIDGRPVLIDAEYRKISADTITRYLLYAMKGRKCIFGKEVGNSDASRDIT